MEWFGRLSRGVISAFFHSSCERIYDYQKQPVASLKDGGIKSDSSTAPSRISNSKRIFVIFGQTLLSFEDRGYHLSKGTAASQSKPVKVRPLRQAQDRLSVTFQLRAAFARTVLALGPAGSRPTKSGRPTNRPETLCSTQPQPRCLRRCW